MKQLSRYAHAVFAHQLHRRHLYTIVVRSTEATFVWFDWAGVLYSPRINLRKDTEVFAYASAFLLMSDRTNQGYDPAFTCEIHNYNRLNYYIDLLASAFTTQIFVAGPTVNEDVQTLRFLVILSDFELHAMHSPALRGVTPVDAPGSVSTNPTNVDFVVSSCIL